MIPPQGRFPVDPEQLRAAIAFQESECELKRRRIEAHKAMDLAHRQWTTELDKRTLPYDDRHPQSAGRSSAVCIAYTQALQEYHHAEIDLLSLDLTRSEAQLAINRAMLAEAERAKLGIVTN